jgi:Type I phosphodiesterase / nucleotide pyrophosphatase
MLARVRLLALVCAGVVAAACIVSAQARRSENVVLVTLDGVRWQDVFGGMSDEILNAAGQTAGNRAAAQEFGGASPRERREKLMPFLWRTLAVQHGFLAGDRGEGSAMSVTNRHWFSYPGYGEILTGQAHDDEIKTNDAIRNPFSTVLEFAARKMRLQPSQVATFASWSTFSAIVEHEPGTTTVNAGLTPYESTAPDLRALNRLQFEAPAPWDDVRHDAFTFRFALDHLTRHHPRILYVAFDETDDFAHDGKYPQVLRAIRRIDGFLSELWTTLQRDPQYRDKTTLIVTVDHGRGRTPADWKGHGKDVPGANEIWIAIASPDTARRGVWRDSPPLYQNQIASTIAAALGLDYREANPNAGAPIALR